MKTIFRLFVLVLLLAGWGLAAASVHVVRTPEKIVIVTQARVSPLNWFETWVDTRGWTMDEASKHPEVVRRLLAAGKADALRHVTDATRAEPAAEQLAAMLKRGESGDKAGETRNAGKVAEAVAMLKSIEF